MNMQCSNLELGLGQLTDDKYLLHTSNEQQLNFKHFLGMSCHHLYLVKVTTQDISNQSIGW